MIGTTYKHYWCDQIEKDELGWAFGKHGNEDKGTQSFRGKT